MPRGEFAVLTPRLALPVQRGVESIGDELLPHPSNRQEPPVQLLAGLQIAPTVSPIDINSEMNLGAFEYRGRAVADQAMSE